MVTVKKFGDNDTYRLFWLYKALSEKSRHMFAPYPLFDTAPSSFEELSRRLEKWRDEDWVAFYVEKRGEMLAFALLKRYRTKQATSSIVVADEYQGEGYGYRLQKYIVDEARRLGLKSFHVKIVSDNIASIKLHEKCGFKKTRVLPNTYTKLLAYLNKCDIKEGRKLVKREIIEMAVEL